MLKFTCECHEEIKVPVSMLGKKFQCPNCKKIDKVELNSGYKYFFAFSGFVCILIAINTGLMAGIAALAIIVVSFVLYTAKRQISDILKKEEAKEKEKLRSDFTPPPECPKCGEDNWKLLETSPNLKSVSWKCDYCNKKVIIKQNSQSHKNQQNSRVIPKSVQNEVWRRDRGRCVECSSKDNIEFDHIIPWSKGGGNTTRNIQLLCQKCNRIKSNKDPGTS